MLKLYYNLFALFIILIQLLTVAMVYTKYSLSAFSDAMMMAMSVAGVVQFLEIMLLDQFMYIYHDAKAADVKESVQLYRFTLTICLITGAAVFICVFIGWKAMPVYFGFGLTGERLKIYIDLMSVMNFGFLFYPFVALNDRLFNAEGFYGTSYLLTSVIHVTFFIGILIVTLWSGAGLKIIGYCYFLGNMLSAAISQIIVSGRMKMGFKPSMHSRYGKKLLITSVMMRLGHNIYSVLFFPVTNIFLAKLPTGFVSVFYYAYRAVIAIFSVSTGPSLKIYMTKVSTLHVKHQYKKIRYFSYKYIRTVSTLYGICALLGFLFIFFFLDKFTTLIHMNISKDYFNTLTVLYVCICIWQYIVIFETRYVAILIVRNLTKEFITTNSIFIIIYAACSYVLLGTAGVYALGFAAITAQLVNLIFYRHYADLTNIGHGKRGNEYAV